MIAYSTTELENQFLIDEAQSLLKAGFISDEQYNQTKSQLPTPKGQKNLLLRLGFALLGVLMYASICGFLSVLGLNNIDGNYTFFLFIFSIIGFIGVEVFAKQNNKGFGLDDTFLIGGQLFLAIAIGASNGYELTIAITATLVAIVTYLRYVNRISVLIFCTSSTAIVVYSLFEMGSVGKTILPFVLMLYAIILYFISKKYTQKVTFLFYHKGILLVKYFSLLLFYSAGNYLVVRELSEELLGTQIAVGSDIPFAFFFYAFTFIVPAIYIFYSLKLKEKIMLWIGLVAIGFSIYTIRYYHHIMPIEISLTVGGILLFAIAYFSIKKLKDATSGITFQQDRFINTTDFLHTEALILTAQFGLQPEGSIDSPMEFGDGGFSGGGSGSSF